MMIEGSNRQTGIIIFIIKKREVGKDYRQGWIQPMIGF